MATVIERRGYTVDTDGYIHYDDRPATYKDAEEIAKRRLDRRRNYAICDGEVRELARWTQECSGCEGCGCRECGYKGRVRHGHWVPLSSNAKLSGERSESA